MLKQKSIAILGAGKLGETLLRALLDSDVVDRKRIVVTTRHRETADARAKTHAVRALTDNRAAVEGADVVIVAVKPQGMSDVLSSIRGSLTRDAVVISTVASVTTGAIECGLGGDVPVIRTMPNTPCLLRAGMTAIAAGALARREHVALAESIFGAMGRTLVLDEKHLDAVTGLSGSGPAFMYVILEALADGGVKMGLPRETATELIAQTMLGAARMVLETREHPAKLKDVVTTPAGCTIDGLLELEEGGLRVTLIKAVVKATQRAAALAGAKS